jgi:hypothetical protein
MGDGLLVVDVDGDEGCLSLIELCGTHDPLPVTRCVSTGRLGGFHFWLRATGPACRNSTGTRNGLAPGIDTRGAGGYVVAPPSVHPHGRLYSRSRVRMAVRSWSRMPRATASCGASSWSARGSTRLLGSSEDGERHRFTAGASGQPRKGRGGTRPHGTPRRAGIVLRTGSRAGSIPSRTGGSERLAQWPDRPRASSATPSARCSSRKLEVSPVRRRRRARAEPADRQDAARHWWRISVQRT